MRDGGLIHANAKARPVRVVSAWVFALSSLVLMLTCWAAFAQTEQHFEIRSAYVEPAEGVYLLNATLVFELADGAREAIREGAPLSFDLDIVVHRSRRYWLDETVATLQQRYELVYHALSERYLLRNVNSGEQVSFATLDAALDSLRVLSNLPIIDQSLIIPDARHEISLRAYLDIRTMPDALRFIVFWARDWRQSTDWYTWSPQS